MSQKQKQVEKKLTQILLNRTQKAEAELAYLKVASAQRELELAQKELDVARKESSQLISNIFMEHGVSNKNQINLANGLILPPDGQETVELIDD